MGDLGPLTGAPVTADRFELRATYAAHQVVPPIRRPGRRRSGTPIADIVGIGEVWMTSETKESRGRRALGLFGSLVGLIATLVIAIAAGLLLHLDTRTSRRLVATQVTDLLRSTFEGDVDIEHIGSLGLHGVEGVRVRARDPEGVQVVHASGVSVRVDSSALVASLLSGHGAIVIDAPSAVVGNADVNLDADVSGHRRIARTFALRASTSTQASPGRSVRLEAPRVRLGHAWVHGALAGAPLVDADAFDLAARAHVDASVTLAELDRVRLVTRALPHRIDPRGTVGGKLVIPAASGKGIDVRAVFDGELGGVPATAEARIDDGYLDGRVDVRDPTGSRTSAFLGEVTLREPLTLHVEAHGALPHLAGRARVVLGDATVDADVVVDPRETTRVEGMVSARNVDLAALSDGLPATQLGLDARAEIAIAADGIHGRLTADTLPGTIDRQPVPRVEMQGRFAGKSAHVQARIHEEVMPTEIRVDVFPRDDRDGRVVATAVRSHIPDLRRVPKIGRAVGGSADIDASARLLLPERSFETMNMDAVLKDVTSAELSASTVQAKARGRGTFARPIIDAEVHGRRLVTHALPLASLDGRARVEIAGKRVRVRDARLDAATPLGEEVTASARLVELHGRDLRVESAALHGVGDPIRAEIAVDASGARGIVDAPHIDLARAFRLAGKEKDLGCGSLAIRAEGVMNRGIARGQVHATFADLSARSLTQVGGVIDASIDDRDVNVELAASAGETGRLDARTDHVVIDGRADDPAAWRRVVGRVHLLGELDLARVSSLIPAERLPIADLRGMLAFQARVERDIADAPPELQLHAHTTGLVVAAPSGTPERVAGVEIAGPARWRSSDVDIGLDVRNDGQSGLTSAALRATDRHGNVIAVDGKAIFPYAEIVRAPSSARARLLGSPMHVTAIVPPRRLDELPSIFALSHMQGVLSAELDVEGTALDPRVRFAAHGASVRSASMPADIDADTEVALRYDGRTADISAKVSSHGEERLDVTSRVEVSARDVVLGGLLARRPPVAWNASGRVRVASFPLEIVPQLADRRIRGRVTGEASLADLHRNARVTGRLDLAGFGVDRAVFPNGAVAFDAGGGTLAASVHLDQTDGSVDANATAGLRWGTATTPSLDAGRPVEGRLVARAFRVAALQPFVERSLPLVDGRIDAEVAARIVPGRPGAELQGTARFRDGTIQVAAFGNDFRSVRADASFAPDGTIRFTDVFARGTQGEIRADAVAKLDGMRIANATANIRVPQRRPLDVSVEGVPIGDISGTIKVSASQSVDATKTNVIVDVPTLAISLPRVTKRGVQTLSRNENVRVGVYRDDRRFVRLPLSAQDLAAEADDQKAEATRIDVDVRLRKVTLSRGNQLRATLSGNPRVTVENGDTKLLGQVSVERGWIDVQGKRFEIEKGIVTLAGESPPDPTVVATAGWTAADGTRVYADFRGAVSTGRLALRSEPPRSKSEILALILFGTADGANPTPPPPGRQPSGATRAAIGLGGGFIAQGLTEALDDLTGIQATARIDTTRANNPRPELDLQISPKVTLRFAHVIGTPPITEPDKNLASFDYRFHRNWSLQTVFGDRGTALIDTLWQKRY